MQAISGCLQIKCLISSNEKSDKTYELSFRIIRFPIGSNSYEIIITNLDRNIFDVKKNKGNLSFEMGNRNFIQRIKICHRINKFPCTKTRFLLNKKYMRDYFCITIVN